MQMIINPIGKYIVDDKKFVQLFEEKGNRGAKKIKLVVLKLTMLKPLVIFSHLRQDSSVTVYNHNV